MKTSKVYEEHTIKGHIVQDVDLSVKGQPLKWQMNDDWEWIITIDVALQHTGGKGGGGIVLRDGFGMFILAFSIYYGVQYTEIDELEAFTLVMALRFIREMGLNEILIESDSRNTVTRVMGIEDHRVPKASHETQEHIIHAKKVFRDLVEDHIHIDIIHRFRECIEVADTFAKTAREDEETIIWMREPGMRMLKREPAGTMFQALFEDAIGISRVLEQKPE